MKKLLYLLTLPAIWILAVINDFFVNLLSDKFNFSDNLAILIAVAIISIIVIGFLQAKKKISVDILVDVLKENHQQQEHAQKVLVLILSRFNPHNDLKRFRENNPYDYKNALENLDYEKLMIDDVSQSNFGHSVTALKAHKSKLEHVWLICSKSSSGKTSQSIDHAPLLEKYIKEKISNKITVHYGDEYTVLLDDDSSVCRSSFKLVKKIYKEAKKLGIKSKEMITDTTGGIRGISVGAILACLNKDESIQIIGTSYDNDGILKGEPYPMVIEYKPFGFQET